MSISFILSGQGTINATINGKTYVVTPGSPGYDNCKEALRERDEEMFVRFASIPKLIEGYSKGPLQVQICNGEVWVYDLLVSNHLTETILKMVENEFPWEPMGLFLQNLLGNPSRRAVHELYRFLELKSLPITDDGCFIGYKRVRSDFKDLHTRTIDNTIGQVVECPRNTVDDDWRVACSSGFHVGSIAYVKDFAANIENPVVLVKVNPRDVVSVPDHEEKLRTCRYEVVGFYDHDLDHLIDTGKGKPAYAAAHDEDDDELEGDSDLEDGDDDESEDDSGY